MTFKSLSVKLNRIIPEAINQATMKEIGQEIKEMVKTRTRKGYGVEKDKGPQTRLKPLKPSYIKQRRRLQTQGKLSKDTTPQKSNFTKSGNAIDKLAFSTTYRGIRIYSKDPKSGKKFLYNVKNGRTIMNLSRSEYNKVKRLLQIKINNVITKKGL